MKPKSEESARRGKRTFRGSMELGTSRPCAPGWSSYSAPPPDSQLAVAVRHLKPGRHALLTYDLSWQAHTRRAIGKVFSKARRAERLWRILETAGKPDSGPVPNPLALIGEHQLVLMEFLEGTDLLSLMLANESAEVETATRSAAAAPAAKANLLLSGVEGLAACLPAAEAPSLIHTGMRPDAVIVSGQRAAFLDLDGWAVGDPALDIGCFCAEVWNEARQSERPDLLPFRDIYLEEYGTRSDTPNLLQRALLYEAFTLIRLVLRRLRRLNREAGQRQLALPDEELLLRAEECLAQATASS